MDEMTYSLDQLEAETGFTKRKIRYYIQEFIGSGQSSGGRDAQYPKLVRDKLLFVSKLQEYSPNLRLADFRSIVEATPTSAITRVVDCIEPLEIADVRTAEGLREFDISAKIGNKHQLIVAVTLSQQRSEPQSRRMTMFSRKRGAAEVNPNNWKILKLDKDVELRIRGEHSSSKLEQLKVLGQLVKSILGNK